MRPELELVWSGQRGVYVGACLSGMESYATRQPLERETERDEFADMPVREAVLNAFRVYGPLTRLQVTRTIRQPYTTVNSALDRLYREGLVLDTGKMLSLPTGGRPARVYGVPRETR